MKYCVVKGCNNSVYNKQKTGKHVAFFAFPKKPEHCEKWIKAIKRNQQDVVLKTNSTVCEEHFNQTNMYKIGFSALRLYEGSIPSIFPNTSNSSITEATCNYEKDNICSEILIEDESTTWSHQEQNIKCSTKDDIASNYKRLVRYPGDVTIKKLENMSSSSLRKSIIMLRKKYIVQQIAMKQLRSRVCSQEKQIKSLKQLLTALLKTYIIKKK